MTGLISSMAERMPRKLFVRLVAYQYRLFEPELGEISRFVPEDKTAIDVGTWWGPWSWWLSRRARRVESFEPNAAICESLRNALPANVEMHNVALSDGCGASVLWSPGTVFGTEGRSTLIAQERPGWVGQDVETVRLDDLAFSGVGFVKVDVEGHELEVLRGGADLLSRERPNVLVEIEQAHQSAEHVDDVFAFMADGDYRGIYFQTGRWHRLEELDRDEARRKGEVRKSRGMLRATLACDGYVNNFLFVPKEASGPAPLSPG